MLEVVFGWHLGGEVKEGVKLQVKWLLFACIFMYWHTVSKTYVNIYVGSVCVCVSALAV